MSVTGYAKRDHMRTPQYRAPVVKLYSKSAPYPNSGAYPRSPIALEDAQRTLRLVRFTLPSGTSIHIRSACLGFHLVATWWWRRAQLLMTAFMLR